MDPAQSRHPAYRTQLGLEDLGSALESADRTKAQRNRDRMIERLAALTSMPTLEAMVEHKRSLHR
ncbi:hypothetical protein [Streptomyces sp. 2A115]|uniref:hypothetical protein n=1 Tax=Streptomyces sp. 2A115 TaxID=3457439 RepID=UPI003FD09158